MLRSLVKEPRRKSRIPTVRRPGGLARLCSNVRRHKTPSVTLCTCRGESQTSKPALVQVQCCLYARLRSNDDNGLPHAAPSVRLKAPRLAEAQAWCFEANAGRSVW